MNWTNGRIIYFSHIFVINCPSNYGVSNVLYSLSDVSQRDNFMPHIALKKKRGDLLKLKTNFVLLRKVHSTKSIWMRGVVINRRYSPYIIAVSAVWTTLLYPVPAFVYHEIRFECHMNLIFHSCYCISSHGCTSILGET